MSQIECVKRTSICVPSGDYRRIVVSVYDTDGNAFDISSASNIVFLVSQGSTFNGSVFPGGLDVFEKNLGNGITLAGTGYQYVVDIEPADTIDLIHRVHYFETAVVTTEGKVTVLCGRFLVAPTQIEV